MTFSPKVNDQLVIGTQLYRIVEHPAVPGIPYGQEGRQGIVYLLEAGSERMALKVFRPRFRTSALRTNSQKLAKLATIPGLEVCRRIVLEQAEYGAVLAQHPDLAWAVLMPWISGPTWAEVLLDRTAITPAESLFFAHALAATLAAMERHTHAHCDLSGANVLLARAATNPQTQHPLALVDLEQLYSPDLAQPEPLVTGSPGYTHAQAVDGCWNPFADRFAGAVLLAEMLGWCQPDVRGAARPNSEQFFDQHEIQTPCERALVLSEALRATYGEPLGQLFDQAWSSRSLEACPSLAAWQAALPALGEQAPKITSMLHQTFSRTTQPPMYRSVTEASAWLQRQDHERRIVRVAQASQTPLRPLPDAMPAPQVPSKPPSMSGPTPAPQPLPSQASRAFSLVQALAHRVRPNDLERWLHVLPHSIHAKSIPLRTRSLGFLGLGFVCLVAIMDWSLAQPNLLVDLKPRYSLASILAFMLSLSSRATMLAYGEQLLLGKRIAPEHQRWFVGTRLAAALAVGLCSLVLPLTAFSPVLIGVLAGSTIGGLSSAMQNRLMGSYALKLRWLGWNIISWGLIWGVAWLLASRFTLLGAATMYALTLLALNAFLRFFPHLEFW